MSAARLPCCNHPDDWHLDMLDGSIHCCGCDCVRLTSGPGLQLKIAWPTSITDAQKIRAREMVSPQTAPTVTGSTPAWPLVIADMAAFGLYDVEDMVIADMYARDEYGREKYKTPLTADNGRDAPKDAYQEVLDMAVYLKAALMSPALGRFRDRLGVLYRTALSDARDLRAMIAERDGE